MLERQAPSSSKAWGLLVRCRAHRCKGGWHCRRTTWDEHLSISWPRAMTALSKGVKVFQPSLLVCLLHPNTVGLRNSSAE